MSSPESLIGRIPVDLQMSDSDQLILVHHRRDEDDEAGERGPSDDLAAPSEEDQEAHRDSVDRDQDCGAEKQETETFSSPSSSVGESAPLGRRVDEDDDGFRTPTSSDHKIPALTQCPPAPRKPKRKVPMSPLRVAGRSAACRNLTRDFSDREFEMMFPPARHNSDPDPDPFVLKLKRPRRDIQEKD